MANKNIDGIAPFLKREHLNALRTPLMNAAHFHDLGKLDKENQVVLHDEVQHRKLIYEHRDAGIKFLYETLLDKAAATLVFAHHKPGLLNVIEERLNPFPFRFKDTRTHTDERIQEYLTVYVQETGTVIPVSPRVNPAFRSTDY